LDMPRELRPTGEPGLSCHGGLRIGQSESRSADIGCIHVAGLGQVLQKRRYGLWVAGFQRGEQRLSVASKMFQVWTGGKLLVHDGFSMHIARIRKQAAQRTCERSKCSRT
jgi:hypothetical protein